MALLRRKRCAGALVILVCPACVACLPGCGRSRSRVDAGIREAGSVTMVNVAEARAEEYAALRPSVSVEVAGGGSATGIASLIDAATDLANCSRRMEPEEIAAAQRK